MGGEGMKQESLLDFMNTETPNEKEQIVLDFSKSVGDPMVEIGRLGLIEFCGKDKFQSFEELEKELKKIFKIYIEKLIISTGAKKEQKNGLTMFWLNNPISYRKDAERAISKIKEVFKSTEIGNCFCCGNHHPLIDADRTIYPLGFSSTNVNFGSSFSSGIKICPICYISLYSMPLNTQKVAGKVGFFIGNTSINKYWYKLNGRYLRKVHVDIHEHDLINSNIDHFENFIYWHINKLSSKEIDFDNISFYIFSNMGNEVSINIQNISNHLIRFLHTFSTTAFGNRLRLEHQKIWNSLIAKHFNYLKYKSDIKLIKTEKKGKKEIILKLKQAIKKEKNRVISKFIRNENIFYFMKSDFEKEREKITDISLKLKYTKAYSSLIFKYLKEVQGMNKERLDFLKELAKKIAETKDGKKFIGEIGRCKNSNSFRRELIGILVQYFKEKGEKLFNPEDIVYKLLPKDTYFAETRDILIVAMYEHLADELKDQEIIIEQPEKGEEDE